MAELDQRWHDLGEFIREQRRLGQLSLRKLSERAGISNPYLSQIERGLRKPSAEILQQIARALSISAETLYVQAGILDPPDGDHDLIASVRRDPHLDEDQKKTLIHIYESFRAENAHAEDASHADDETPLADSPLSDESTTEAADATEAADSPAKPDAGASAPDDPADGGSTTADQ